MTLSEKSAYLKGLMDGLKLDTEKDEGKMIAAIVDMLSDVAETVSDLEEDVYKRQLHDPCRYALRRDVYRHFPRASASQEVEAAHQKLGGRGRVSAGRSAEIRL